VSITEQELFDAIDEYKNVGVAHKNAVAACVNLLVEKKRYEAKPGFFAKLRLKRRAVDASNFAGVLLSTYCAVKNYVSDGSDADMVIAFVNEDAKRIVRRADQDERGRKVNRDLRKALGVPDDVDFG
jgi:hypothetical protein